MQYASYQNSQILNGLRLSRASDGDGQQVQFGDHVFVIGDQSVERATNAGASITNSGRVAAEKQLYLVRQKGRLFELSFPDIEVLHDAGRFLAIGATDEEYSRIKQHSSHCFDIGALPVGGSVFERRPPSASRHQSPTWVRTYVELVTASGFLSALGRLVAFPTRHSETPHYRDAATLCNDILTGYGFESHVQEVPIGQHVTANVVADKIGTGGNRDLVIVMAHLDSINSRGNSNSVAPGADDNASGSAGVLEIARILKNHDSVHDLRLVLFGGEELGLFGSKHFVSGMSEDDKSRLSTAVNMDMIAGNNLPTPSVLIEAGKQSVLDELGASANAFTSLMVETSLNPFASDHVPFIDVDLPAALTIEGADSGNDKIHTADDTLKHIDAELASQIIRMNVGHVAQKIGNSNA